MADRLGEQLVSAFGKKKRGAGDNAAGTESFFSLLREKGLTRRHGHRDRVTGWVTQPEWLACS